jgi:hypothetical protein
MRKAHGGKATSLFIVVLWNSQTTARSRTHTHTHTERERETHGRLQMFCVVLLLCVYFCAMLECAYDVTALVIVDALLA